MYNIFNHQLLIEKLYCQTYKKNSIKKNTLIIKKYYADKVKMMLLIILNRYIPTFYNKHNKTTFIIP